MAYLTGRYPIVKKENLAKDVYSFEILCPEIASQTQSGQFVQVKADGFFLRRPISVCGATQTTLRLVMQVRGDGTEQIARLNVGDMMDLIGPLGKGFTLLPPGEEAVAVGGGIGVPPLVQALAHYGENGAAIIGFRSASAVILKEDFEKAGNAVTLCTDDGTAGEKGFVTTALEARLQTKKPAIIYACGPKVMLDAVAGLAKKYGVRCEVSMEERMGCGVGACLCCACRTVKNGEEHMKHVCKDGPVFPAEEVVPG